MRRLAKLASCLILSVGVGVRQALGGEQCEQDGQGNSQHPDSIASRVVLAKHLDLWG